MKRKVTLSLTRKELSLLAAIRGFVEAGEVDGGPLDDESSQQRAANIRLFGALSQKVALAHHR
jgi:hypothetical protein